MEKTKITTPKRIAEKFVENMVKDVRYVMRKGQYYFSLRDVAHKLGYKITDDAKKLCRQLEHGIYLSDGQFAITFDDLLQLAKNAKNGFSDDFIDALQNEVSLNRKESENQIVGNHPDFSNPAEAARAWAELYEQRESLQARLENALEKLGDAKDYKIVCAIPWLADYFLMDRVGVVSGVIGSKLSNMSKKTGKSIRKCMPFGYKKTGAVGMYNVDVISQFREFLDKDALFLANYRKKKAKA